MEWEAKISIKFIGDDSNFKNLSIAKIVKTAINEYTFKNSDEKNLININLENDFTFFGDKTLVIYVLFNLLKNALHYRVKSDIFIAKVQKLWYNYI